jgi:chemotaxis protein MotB
MGKLCLVLAALLAFAPGCVTSGTHKTRLAAAKKAHDDDLTAAKQREADLTKNLTETTAERDTLKTDKAALQKQVDITTATNLAMEDRLKQLGQDVSKLTTQNKSAQAQLEELRRAKAAAEARVATFRNLVAKLQSMIDSGELKVVIRNGRMIIALPNDILFDSGSTAVKPDGQKALQKVAQVLNTVSDRVFLVAGHTDNIPIKTARYASNWELSTERAVNVVQLLIKKGNMSPTVLSAAGYSEHDPVAANDSEKNRALNRRIEIVLQPNLSDLPSLDDLR